jgi:hypothetical protein
VLTEEYGVKKIIIPFHFNKATTSFDLKKILQLPSNRIWKIEYTYADNKSASAQVKLNEERIDVLASSFLKKLDRCYQGIYYSTIIQTKENDRRNLFTGFIISFEVKARGVGSKFEKEILTGYNKTKLSTKVFEIDTLSEYDYHLFRYFPNNGSDEYKLAIKTFKKYKSWEDKLIVTDVTGSMYPYMRQYMLWLKLNYEESEKQYYVFFNDGNDLLKKSPSKKKIGSTGGIFYCSNQQGFDKVLATAAKAMNSGAGGDIIENDVEAVIKGADKYKNAKNVILIAHNNAPPRDMEILEKLEKPVRVILCGVLNDKIQPAYINLAFKTRGSIHTMEQDLFFAAKSKNGKIFTYLGQEFKVVDGKLVKNDKT